MINVDTFKKNYGHEGKSIIGSYIRELDFDTVCVTFNDVNDAIKWMDRLDAWDEYLIFEIDVDGNALNIVF